ncbi:GAF domain-containing protein [Pontibaca methylaminivorans]|uniref:GAF domain-containing protein n=1 Tax=Pontibaca methylaminivorans TaxID=515897 RepID=UPI002FD93BF1
MPTSDEWPRGAGAMIRRIREHDWSATPLGAITGWPADLRFAVDLMLNSPLAMVLLRGPELVQIYNEAGGEVVDSGSGAALGTPLREGFAQLHRIIAPLQARIRDREPVILPEVRLPVRRGGTEHEAWWDLQLLPQDDGDGVVTGILVLLIERTDAVVARRRMERAMARQRASEERQGFLLRLSDALRPLNDPFRIQETAVRLLTEQLDVPGAAYFTIGKDGNSCTRTAKHEAVPLPLPDHGRLSDFGAGLAAEFRAGRTLALRDIEAEPLHDWQRSAFRDLGLRAGIVAPLVKDGRLFALVGVGSIAPRDWSDTDIRIIEDVAERTWAAVARAQAEAGLHDRDRRHRFLLRLSDALRIEAQIEEVIHVGLRMLAEELELDLCVAVRADPSGQAEVLHQIRRSERIPAMAPRLPLADIPGAGRFVPDRALTFSDMRSPRALPAADRRRARRMGFGALVSVPLSGGLPRCSLMAVSALPRLWSAAEVVLIENASERIGSRLANLRTEAALRESEQRFRQFADASTSVLWIRDARTLRMVFASRAFRAIYGCSCDGPGEDGLRCWLRMVLPQDRRAVLDKLRRTRRGEQVEHEFRIRTGETGEQRWIAATDFPMSDARGQVQWIAGLGADVTATRLAAERQHVLVAELQHRTRNLITVIGSLASRTLQRATSLEDFGQRFGQRLSALSRVQGLLSQLATGDRVAFDRLLRTELVAHGAVDGAAAKVTLEGPTEIPLRSSMVQTLALALHELATNAVKHGALAESQPEGRLLIRWWVEPNTSDPRLHIEWRESGVDMTQAVKSARYGYGRELLERALPYQHGAITLYRLQPDGVHCAINVAVHAGAPAPA